MYMKLFDQKLLHKQRHENIDLHIHSYNVDLSDNVNNMVIVNIVACYYKIIPVVDLSMICVILSKLVLY